MDSREKTRLYHGFTLVELLVVISIIALLLSILMPSLSKAREQAKRVICASNMKQVVLALQMYSLSNDGSLVPYRGTPSDSQSWDSKLAYMFSTEENDSLKKYLTCPSDRKPRNPSKFFGKYGGDKKGVLARSYLPNGALPNFAHAGMVTFWTDRSYNAVRASKVESPQKVLYLIECFIGAHDENYAAWPQSGDVWETGGIQGTNYYDYSSSPPSVKGYTNASGTMAMKGDQHSDGANWVFIDGHLEWQKYDSSSKDLYHAYGGGIVYPFSWLTTKANRKLAERFGWKP
jgi:prepilin-type N-terminal cleavage/methylation domain-containing protein/prepilin-type processing-associated H-X9-DG protein